MTVEPAPPKKPRKPGENVPPSQDDAVSFGVANGMTYEQAVYCWNWWESAGWKRRGGMVKNWQKTMLVWRDDPRSGNAQVKKKATMTPEMLNFLNEENT